MTYYLDFFNEKNPNLNHAYKALSLQHIINLFLLDTTEFYSNVKKNKHKIYVDNLNDIDTLNMKLDSHTIPCLVKGCIEYSGSNNRFLFTENTHILRLIKGQYICLEIPVTPYIDSLIFTYYGSIGEIRIMMQYIMFGLLLEHLKKYNLKINFFRETKTKQVSKIFSVNFFKKMLDWYQNDDFFINLYNLNNSSAFIPLNFICRYLIIRYNPYTEQLEGYFSFNVRNEMCANNICYNFSCLQVKELYDISKKVDRIIYNNFHDIYMKYIVYPTYKSVRFRNIAEEDIINEQNNTLENIENIFKCKGLEDINNHYLKNSQYKG